MKYICNTRAMLSVKFFGFFAYNPVFYSVLTSNSEIEIFKKKKIPNLTPSFKLLK